MKSQYCFRPVDSPDVKAVLGLMKEYYFFDHLIFHEKKAAAALRSLLKNPSLGRVWLIERGSEAIGYFILTFGFIVEFHGRHVVIDEIYIRESHRGRGVGRKALKWIERLARSMGIKVIRLEVERNNTGAKRIYHRAKFSVHGRDLMTKVLRAERR